MTKNAHGKLCQKMPALGTEGKSCWVSRRKKVKNSGLSQDGPPSRVECYRVCSGPIFNFLYQLFIVLNKAMMLADDTK